MAATSDTQRTAIRERKRQAQAALRERLEVHERLQGAAFASLDRLAGQLQRAGELLAGDEADALQRAATVGAIAGQLGALIATVRHSASELVEGASLTHAEVADLLGVRSATLFPRRRSHQDPVGSAVGTPADSAPPS